MRSHLGDLLYYSGSGSSGGVTYILTFPQGKLVGQFDGNGQLCPDTAGNVWVSGYPSGSTNELAKFAHGGETPIKTLTATQTTRVLYCAVDPTTGDLAAMGNRHDVFIFSGASAPAKVLKNSFYSGPCTYDSRGDLFVAGFSPANHFIDIYELSKGASKFRKLRGFHPKLNYTSGLRWDGKRLTIGQPLGQGGHEIYRYVVRVRLHSPEEVDLTGGFIKGLGDYWISGSYAVATSVGGGSGGYSPIDIYNYPTGGYPITTIGQGVVPYLNDANVIVSVAPK